MAREIPQVARSDQPTVAVIIPIHDNESVLDELHRAIGEALEARPWQVEICYVDDRSSDGSWAWITNRATRDDRVRGVRLDRNRGQTAAVVAGFTECDADVLVTMDGDLDFSPSDLPGFVEGVLAGHDVVAGRRLGPTGPLMKRRLPSSLLNIGLRVLGGYRLGDVGCGFFAIDRSVRDRMVLAGDRRRAIRALVGDLSLTPIVHPVRYRSGGVRDPATVGRVVTVAIDQFAAIPRVRRRTLAAGALGISLHLVGRRPGDVGPRAARSVGVLGDGVAVASAVTTMALASRRRRWQRLGDSSFYRVADRAG